ncbi:MAG: alanine--glyoxylate aminotransferase family protein [Deltaproteobacteria bacterium]|nr:alanine--glyoxylate aminotransferase family protein [Deltaproteobacteria bacterium]
MSSFHPPKRLLLGPGPSEVHPRVLHAMAEPTVGHLDPVFVALMDDTKAQLRRAFRTANELTMPISGPGSAGMEACLINLLEPNDSAIICRNGVFGSRMVEIAQRAGARVVVVEDGYGDPVSVEKVEQAFAEHPAASLLAFVHAETSTGARSDAESLSRVAHERGALVLMDAVTSLGGIPVEVDAWGIDAVYSGSQKCLSCPPGLSPITMGERAVQKIKTRKSKVQSWFLDLDLVMGYWGKGKRSYHHTAPVNAIYGLHEALVMLEEEGLEAAWERHARHHLALRGGLEELGLRFVVSERFRLPQLNTVFVPEGVDDAAVRSSLLTDFGIEIGGGLGPLAGKVWRIGLMGQSSSPLAIRSVLMALEAVLIRQGRRVRAGKALAAADAVLASQS